MTLAKLDLTFFCCMNEVNVDLVQFFNPPKDQWISFVQGMVNTFSISIHQNVQFCQ